MLSVMPNRNANTVDVLAGLVTANKMISEWRLCQLTEECTTINLPVPRLYFANQSGLHLGEKQPLAVVSESKIQSIFLL